MEMQRMSRGAETMIEVVVIGAGPYGLSIAAHLAANKIPYRIFGKPMSAWSTQMPKGMHLKSEGFASSLSHPSGSFTLKEYCAERAIPYQETGLPVKLETFVAYGLAFKQKFVPDLEEKLVKAVLAARVGFEVELEDGEKLYARNVVVASGIGHFAHIPEVLRSLSPETISHSGQHSGLQAFRGRDVAVVGSGASALDMLTLLHEAGARVQLISRSEKIHFHDPPGPRSLKTRITQPRTGLGSGLELVFCVRAPRMFRHLPERIRLDRVKKVLGPAPGWFVRDRIVGKAPFHTGCEIEAAKTHGGKAILEVRRADGKRQTIEADHVIAATGYQVDLERLQFLTSGLRERIQLTGKAPRLSSHFESTVPGLYFVGITAANTFGPLMRFAYGAAFTAASLAKHFRKRARRTELAQNPVRLEYRSAVGVTDEGLAENE